jgi:hypothetical protein
VLSYRRIKGDNNPDGKGATFAFTFSLPISTSKIPHLNRTRIFIGETSNLAIYNPYHNNGIY